MKTSKNTSSAGVRAASQQNATAFSSVIGSSDAAHLVDHWDLEKYISFFPEIPESGKSFMRRAIQQPCRRPNGRLSITTRWPSIKTKQVCTAESDSAELPAVVMADHMDEVLHFVEQPGTLSINESPLQTAIYPDLLLFLTSGPVLLECRTAAGMARKLLKSPLLYQQDEQGHYMSKPAERSAAQMGMLYRINTERDYSATFVQNLLLLQPYYRTELRQPITARERSAVLEAVKARPGIAIPAIPFATESRRSDVVHAMLTTGELFAQLDRYDLRNQSAIQLFHTPLHRDVNAMFLGRTRRQVPLNGQMTALLSEGAIFTISRVSYRVVRHSEKGVCAVCIADGKETAFSFHHLNDLEVAVEPVECRESAEWILANLGEKEMQQLRRVRRQLVPYLPGGHLFGKSPSNRTLRRKLRAFRLKEAATGVGELGLIPRTKMRGNRKSARTETSIALFEKAVKEVFMEKRKVTARYLHNAYTAMAEAAGLPSGDILCYESVARRLKKIPQHLKVLAQQGKRAALKFRPPTSAKSILGAPNGSAPWSVGHMDHTKMDVLVINPDNDHPERPWISSLVDSFDGRLLAFCVWFGDPNRQVVIELILDCVRRHGVLPMRIRCDWGTEFRSTTVEKALADIGVALSFRKKGEPRDGSPVETSFTTLNKVWLHNAKGNTVPYQTPRNTSRSHDPKHFVAYEMETFVGLVNEFIEVENNNAKEHKLSPNQTCAKFLEEYGEHFAHRVSPGYLSRLNFVARSNNTRVVSQKGTVRFRCADYVNSALASYVGEEISVFFDEKDPRSIQVETADSRRRITCEVVDSELRYAYSAEHARDILERRSNGGYDRKKVTAKNRGKFQRRIRRAENATEKALKAAPPKAPEPPSQEDTLAQKGRARYERSLAAKNAKTKASA